MEGPEFSVVVCTRNRAELLRTCLATLAAQEFQVDRYEIIVVDNASSDGTQSVARLFVADHPNVRVFREEKIGLSNARNRGWREARGTYVAYVDDECKVPAAWLATARGVAQAHHPEMFGGPYAPWYASRKPPWFKDSYESTESLRVTARFLDAGEFLFGGNMFIRRDVLLGSDGFDPRLGMTGRKLRFAEENAFQLRLREARPDAGIYYDPGLLLYHMVRPEKMRLSHVVRFRFKSGFYFGKVTSTARPQTAGRLLPVVWTAKELLTHASLFVWHCSLGTLSRDRRSCPHARSHVYERGLPHAHTVGALLWELWRLTRLRKAPA